MAQSTLAKAFTKAFGKPSPRAEPGLRFVSSSMQSIWESIHEEIGAGWYRNGFLYLFGEGLDELRSCLDSWSFLVPHAKHPLILGRNAYGALLVMPDSAATNPAIGVLDPTRVSWTSPAGMTLGNLLGARLPDGMLPDFTDEAPYQAWRRAGGQRLETNEMLAPKVAVALGGTMDVDNFEVRDIVSYYAVTGPIYRKAGKGGSARKVTRTRRDPGHPR